MFVAFNKIKTLWKDEPLLIIYDEYDWAYYFKTYPLSFSKNQSHTVSQH